MSPERLVYMANQIGKFFVYQPKQEVVAGIANHIRKFWEPRMRKDIFAYIDAGGEGIDPPVLEALQRLKAQEQSATKRPNDNQTSFQGS